MKRYLFCFKTFLS